MVKKGNDKTILFKVKFKKLVPIFKGTYKTLVFFH